MMTTNDLWSDTTGSGTADDTPTFSTSRGHTSVESDRSPRHRPTRQTLGSQPEGGRRFTSQAGRCLGETLDHLPARPVPHIQVGGSPLRLDADRLPTPRADGDREALRILLGTRQELTTASTAQTNRLRALLLGGDDTDRELARGALTETRLASLARRRPPREASREQAVRHAEIRRLALALREAARAVKANRAQLQTIVNDLVPGLIERPGIGPVSAAQAIVSFSHSGRCRNDAAFAALGGASPLPASSGRTVRHRLNRGGDRALNRALHTIAATRMRSCPTTQAYVARRTAEGKNPREIRRCLKRYIARQLYRTLATAMTPAAETS